MIDWKQSRIHETLKLINKKVEILYEAPTAAQGIVLICHPHPLFQGSMHNKVVVTLAKAARQAGFSTLRFNFSGVGLTDGPYTNFKDEVSLVETFMKNIELSDFQLKIIGGFSFGGAAALCATPYDWPRILIAPAWHILRSEHLWEEVVLQQHYTYCHILHCQHDTIIPQRESVQGFEELISLDKKLTLYGSGDHFFQQYQDVLKNDLTTNFTDILLKLKNN